MRNGPCGGTFNGQCEVIPEKPCIWVGVYNRAKTAGQVEDLKTYIPPRKLSLKGTSSWINLFLDRDSRPGNNPEPLKVELVQIKNAGIPPKVYDPANEPTERVLVNTGADDGA
jgi:methylenetetrahydrofolate reductase (NADPH)